MSNSLQQQARALGDPTRHRIFRRLVEDGAAGVIELTEHTGLHHNAVRQHLAKLVAAGLVIKRLQPSAGRGRPRQLFEVDPGASERWGAGGPYERLSLMLLDMIRTGDTAVEVGRREGRKTTPAAVGSEPVARLRSSMAAGGFDPVTTLDGDSAVFTLQTCPFVSAAASDPETICSLHLGIAEGLASGEQGVRVEGLEPRDPRLAGCILRFGLQAS